MNPSSLLILKDSLQSGGGVTVVSAQTVEILSCEVVQASIRGPASALEAEGRAIETWGPPPGGALSISQIDND